MGNKTIGIIGGSAKGKTRINTFKHGNKFDKYSDSERLRIGSEIQEEIKNRQFAINAVVKLREKKLYEFYIKPALLKNDDNAIEEAEQKYKEKIRQYEAKISQLLEINELKTDLALIRESSTHKKNQTNF